MVEIHKKIEEISDNPEQDPQQALLLSLVKEWLSVSESQICSTEVLCEELPQMNELIETNINALSSHFSGMASNLQSLEKAIATLKEQQSTDSADAKDQGELYSQMEEIFDENKAIMSKVMVNMQFQDRVSQRLVIAAQVIKLLHDYTESSVEHSIPTINKKERKELLDKDFSKELIDTLKLGELQQSFIKHLLEHEYIQNASELGITEHDTDDVDDVELF